MSHYTKHLPTRKLPSRHVPRTSVAHSASLIASRVIRSRIHIVTLPSTPRYIRVISDSRCSRGFSHLRLRAKHAAAAASAAAVQAGMLYLQGSETSDFAQAKVIKGFSGSGPHRPRTLPKSLNPIVLSPTPRHRRRATISDRPPSIPTFLSTTVADTRSRRFGDAGDDPNPRFRSDGGPSTRAAFSWQEAEGYSEGKEREWQEIGNADVLVPKGVEFPLGLVHFVGGQGVGVFPRSAYGTLLEAVGDAGFLVVATRVRLNEFNHEALACDVARDFRVAYREVEALYGGAATRRIPLFGVGHSLGAKVHVLLSCYPEVAEVARRRKANVMISFNNFPAKESVPFLNELRDLGLSLGDMSALGDNLAGLAKAVSGLPLVSGIATKGLSMAEDWAPKAVAAVGLALSEVPQEFKPSPQATWQLIMDSYSVRNNLVLQFKRDSIDQSPRLAETLFERFGRDGQLEFSRLDGTHVTPNTPDYRDTRQARDWAKRAGLGSQGDAFVKGGAKAAASTASVEMDALISTLTSYLRSQSLWVRREGRWDSDDM